VGELRVAAVKRRERRDRFYAVRPDGSEASWAVASAPGLPHDLHHLVAERGLRLRRGFWGMVADGMEPGHLRGVSDHLAAGGDATGLTELLQAEAAVAHLLGGPDATPEERLAALAAMLAARGVPGLPATGEDVVRLRAEAAALAAEWARLAPGEALHLTFAV
jgi:hypothetical protein